MKLVRIVLVGLLWLVAAVTYARPAEEVFEGTVVRIIDGNTVEVLTENDERCQVLLHEIDCPELGQAFGLEAKSFMEKTLLNEKVVVKIVAKDRWGNRLAVVSKNAKTDVRIALLKEGLAWTAERNPNEAFEKLRTEAEQRGRGLWSETQPTPPWSYRRQQTMMQVKSN